MILVPRSRRRCAGTDVGRPDAGAVTAELATGLIGVVVVLGALFGVGVVAQAQLACIDAARAAARAAARGEPTPQVVAVARRLVGPEAHVSTSQRDGLVTVAVGRRVEIPLPGSPEILVESSATSAVEDVPSGGPAP